MGLYAVILAGLAGRVGNYIAAVVGLANGSYPAVAVDLAPTDADRFPVYCAEDIANPGRIGVGQGRFAKDLPPQFDSLAQVALLELAPHLAQGVTRPAPQVVRR